MVVEPGRWCPLTLEAVSWVPDHPGVFEVANLVRSVLYIDRAHGCVRDRLAELARARGSLPRAVGGYYFRYLETADEAGGVTRLLDAYRAHHAGALPRANRLPRPSLAGRQAA